MSAGRPRRRTSSPVAPRDLGAIRVAARRGRGAAERRAGRTGSSPMQGAESSTGPAASPWPEGPQSFLEGSRFGPPRRRLRRLSRPVDQAADLASPVLHARRGRLKREVAQHPQTTVGWLKPSGFETATVSRLASPWSPPHRGGRGSVDICGCADLADAPPGRLPCARSGVRLGLHRPPSAGRWPPCQHRTGGPARPAADQRAARCPAGAAPTGGLLE